MKKYYELQEYIRFGENEKFTEDIISLGGKHYENNTYGSLLIKRFCILLSEEELIFAKLKFGIDVGIFEISKNKLDFLLSSGFIDK